MAHSPATPHAGPPPPPAPRALTGFKRPLGATFAVIIAGPFFLVAVFVAVMTLLETGNPLAGHFLDQNHADANAEVTARKVTGIGMVNGKNVVRLTVRYADAEGKRRKATLLSRRDAQVGDSLAIEYDPDTPSRARPARGAYGVGMLWMVAGFFGISLPFLLYGLVVLGRQVHLYRHGIPVQARVTGLEKTTTRHRRSSRRDRFAYWIQYTYQGPEGVLHGSHVAFDPPPLGAVIWVLIHPKAPHRSVIA